MAKPKKTSLICTRSHGRWCKGDIAGFEPDRAKKMIEAKNAAWKPAPAAKKGSAPAE